MSPLLLMLPLLSSKQSCASFQKERIQTPHIYQVLSKQSEVFFLFAFVFSCACYNFINGQIVYNARANVLAAQFLFLTRPITIEQIVIPQSAASCAAIFSLNRPQGRTMPRHSPRGYAGDTPARKRLHQSDFSRKLCCSHAPGACPGPPVVIGAIVGSTTAHLISYFLGASLHFLRGGQQGPLHCATP